jgi:hypothetical protein
VRFFVRQYAHLGALARLAQLPTELEIGRQAGHRHPAVRAFGPQPLRHREVRAHLNAAGKSIGSGLNLAATAGHTCGG